jgi:hypothetical protein
MKKHVDVSFPVLSAIYLGLKVPSSFQRCCSTPSTLYRHSAPLLFAPWAGIFFRNKTAKTKSVTDITISVSVFRVADFKDNLGGRDTVPAS